VPEDRINGKDDPPVDIYRPPRQWGQTTRILFGDQSFETSLASYQFGADGAMVVLAREIDMLHSQCEATDSEERSKAHDESDLALAVFSIAQFWCLDS
jgi:hypothetical protein